MIKRILGLTNCHGEKRLGDGMQPCFAGYSIYYYGYIFGKQPSSAEVQRAISSLMSNERISYVCTFNEDSIVGVSELESDQCLTLEMHRIVFTCVDAKNQKIVAIFYHNPDNPAQDITSLCGLECHLFMCKTKEQARKYAERIRDELLAAYRKRRRERMELQREPTTRAFAKYVSYENLKPRNKLSAFGSQSRDEISNGSASTTFPRSSSTTVASFDTEYRQTSSSGIWESLQELELASEDALNPSTVPKPQVHECSALVHRHIATPARPEMGKILEEDPRIDASELATLIDMAETDI